MLLKTRKTSLAKSISISSLLLFLLMLPNFASADVSNVLIKASEHGEIYSVKSAIENGADVNAKSIDDMTSLMYASMGGYLKIVRALIINGADVNARTKEGVTSLMYATMGGYDEIVKVLIFSRADVNAKTNDGKTVLMIASVDGHLEIVKLLLSNGADVNLETKSGLTALLLASTNGYKKVEEVLLEAGAHAKNIPPSAKPIEGALHPVPVAIPARPPIPDNVVKQTDTAKPIVTIPVMANNALPSTVQIQNSTNNKQEQNHNVFTLSAGEIVNRSNLDILLQKLENAGLQPIVQKKNIITNVFRLVAGCFSEESAAQKNLNILVRKDKHAFMVKTDNRFCVVAASCFSIDDALAEQKRFAKKEVHTEISKTHVPVTAWLVTVGRYNDSKAATEVLKSLAERHINVVLMPLEN